MIYKGGNKKNLRDDPAEKQRALGVGRGLCKFWTLQNETNVKFKNDLLVELGS